MINKFSTIQELKELLEKKQITKAEIISFYQNQIKTLNPNFNAVIELFDKPEEELDLNKIENDFLKDIPTLFKDNFAIAKQTCSAGSNILKNYKPVFNSTMKKRVCRSGGIILGRTNMDEFAMGSSGEFSAYGPAKNPWDESRTPGGSSSGSAAAVAAGMVPWALGSETGGSVRQPASFCGLVGMYPTYGLLSRFGMIAFGSSLDQPGPITRTVQDCATVLSSLAGHDAYDSTSLPEAKRDYTKNLDGSFDSNLKIGVINDSIESEGVNDEVKKHFENSIKVLENRGVKISYIDLPDLKYAISVYFVISRAEASSNLYRIDGSLFGQRDEAATSLEQMYQATRNSGFGNEVKRRILTGNYLLSSSHKSIYNKATQIRSMIRCEFEDAYERVDLLMSPTVPTLPFKLKQEVNDPLAMYMADYFTVPNCVAGYPAISVPCGLSQDNLPVGIQFIGPRLSEQKLLKTAHAFEQEIQLNLKKEN